MRDSKKWGRMRRARSISDKIGKNRVSICNDRYTVDFRFGFGGVFELCGNGEFPLNFGTWVLYKALTCKFINGFQEIIQNVRTVTVRLKYFSNVSFRRRV